MEGNNMSKQRGYVSCRSFLLAFLVAAFLTSVIVPTADARRGRNAVQGAVVGAGVGALVGGSSGARKGAVAGAIVGAVR